MTPVVWKPASTLHDMREAADQQRGADEQHDRQRQFADHQHALRAPAGAARRGAVQAFALERRLRVEPPRLQQRHQPEDDAGHHRQSEREGQHAPIERDRVEPRHTWRCQGQQRAQGRDGQDDADNGACQREHEILEQELPRQPPDTPRQAPGARPLRAPGRGPG